MCHIAFCTGPPPLPMNIDRSLRHCVTCNSTRTGSLVIEHSLCVWEVLDSILGQDFKWVDETPLSNARHIKGGSTLKLVDLLPE